jgi:arylsulfatase A-like enzyme
MQDYLACVQGVDDNIGRTLDYLEKTGLAKNTIVIYTADNGFFLGDLGLYDKRFMYEPSLHVPLLVRGPGVKVGGGRGTLRAEQRFRANLPRTCRAARARGHAGPLTRPYSQRRIAGRLAYVDVLPLLSRSPVITTRTRITACAPRRTKLIYYWKQDAWEMFDLVADPTEQKNLAGDPPHSTKFDELKAEMLRLKKGVQG